MTTERGPSAIVKLIGPTSVRVERVGEIPVTRPQVQLVLTRLLWDLQPISIDALAELLWGDAVMTEHWRGAVRGVLSKVRAVFVRAGVDAEIRVTADGRVNVVLPDDCVIDVHAARAEIGAAERALESGRPDRTASLIADWVERLDHRVLPASDGEWVDSANREIEELARRALLLRARAALMLGRSAGVEPALRKWVTAHPLDEEMHHRLIEAFVAAGRRSDARAALDRLTVMLEVELGIGPTDATRALLGDIDGRAGVAVASSDGDAARVNRSVIGVRSLGPLLGRATETEQLREAWDTVVAQRRPQLVLLRGTSGIGKTRLALELGSTVAAQGYQTMLCQCMPGASMPFEPLASTLLSLDDRADSPEILGAFADPSASGPGGSAVARQRLFESVVNAVGRNLDEPLLLVIDDLQWIGSDALMLLEHLVTATQVPLLVVATGRELPDAVHEMLARLARRLAVRTSVIMALSAGDLVALFAEMNEPDAHRAAATLHRHTGGHPFYIAEIVAAARRGGDDIDAQSVPDAVREWMSHRLDSLPRTLRSRLELATGDRARRPGCRSRDVFGVLLDVLLDEFDELVELGLMIEGDEPGQYSVPHQIIAEVVYAGLSTSRRSRLHLAAAEGLIVSNPTINPAVVADHFLAAGPSHTKSAVQLLSRAADEAYARGAWAVAAEHRRAVLAVVPDDPETRAAALVGLAKALHLQGDKAHAGVVLEEAIGIARSHGLALTMAEAVIALAGRAGRGVGTHDDAAQMRLLEEALAALEAAVAADPSPPDHNERRRRDSLHCQVEIELAVASSLWAPIERRTALVLDAVERSRRIQPPDRDLLAQVSLGAHTVRFGPAQVHDRLDAEEEALAIPLAARSLDTTLTALIYRYEDLLCVGRRTEARSAP